MNTFNINIDHLPQELLVDIFQNLPRLDLRNIRLVCRLLKPSADRILFRTVHLRCNYDSFWKLEHLYEHHILRTYVTCIEYTPCYPETRTYELQFTNWLQQYAGSKFRIPAYRRKLLLSSMDTDELRLLHQAFCVHMAGQYFIERQDAEKQCIRLAVAAFPLLQSIRFSQDLHAWNFRRGDLDPKFYQPLADKFLDIPPPLRTNEDRFWNLISAAMDSHPSLLAHIRCSQLKLEVWDEVAGSHIEQFPSLANLRDLLLDFSGGDSYPSRAPNLEQLLLQLPSLRSLTLKFRFCLDLEGLVVSLPSLPTVISSEHIFCNLRNLSLSAFSAQSGDLRAFLGNHARSLRVLELSIGDFLDDPCSNAGSNDSNLLVLGESGLWIAFFLFLKQDMFLDQVKLFGAFTSGEDERWCFHCKCDDVSMACRFVDQSAPVKLYCLKRRVERSIANNEPFPFTRVAQGGQPTIRAGLSIPWTWIDHASLILCNRHNAR